MNKKAQFEVARKSIYWLLAGFMIAIMLLGFSLTIVNYKNKLTSIPPELTASFIAMRFTNIAECFAYQDHETGRVYPGIIDLEKFNEEHLTQSCYRTEDTDEMNFGFTLLGYNKSIQTNYYRNHFKFNFFPEVLVKDGDNYTSDNLTIRVQVEI